MKLPRSFFWFILLCLAGSPAVSAADFLVYFGTRDPGPDKGFSLAHFDSTTGAMTPPALVEPAMGPGFFQIAPDGRHLYTANTRGLNVPGDGMVSAYNIDLSTGKLTLINSQPSGGPNPAYLSLDKSGKFVLIANYNGGSVAVFPIKPDGSLGPRTAFDQHTGKSVTPDRAQQAYAHSIITDPTNQYALDPDLGLDRIYIYKFDAKTGALAINDIFQDKPGSGPRHIIFHPNGMNVYVVHEIANTVNMYVWKSADGTLTEVQSLSTLPAGFTGTNTAAEVQIHPNGKFLYVSNRGQNGISLFSIDPPTGIMTYVSNVPTQGKTPRNFTLDPSGQWLLASNQDSNSAIIYKVDQATGKLTQTGALATLPAAPFCERFVAVPPVNPKQP